MVNKSALMGWGIGKCPAYKQKNAKPKRVRYDK
jgi:hypothetical protein